MLTLNARMEGIEDRLLNLERESRKRHQTNTLNADLGLFAGFRKTQIA